MEPSAASARFIRARSGKPGILQGAEGDSRRSHFGLIQQLFIDLSGGENISTIEVEGVLYRHPAVQEAAVVARPPTGRQEGETPCAFITLRGGHGVTAHDIIQSCRKHIAHFKCPKTVIFSELAKTSTGKIQKCVLRERARELPSFPPAL